MKNIILLTLNTLRVTFRRKGNIIIYVILPILGILISSAIYGGSGTRPINVGVVDQDASRLSAAFVESMKQWGNYRTTVVEEKDINGNLLDGKQDCVLVIPAGYEKSLWSGSAEKIRLISVKGQESTVFLENFINLYGQNLSDIVTVSGEDRALFDRLYKGYQEGALKMSVEKLKDERSSKNATVLGLGMLIMFVMLGAGMTSQFILNEKKNRTYYRICSAPVRVREYLAGNAITSLLIVTVQVVFVQLLMKVAFRIETFIPDLVLFLLLFTFGIVATGFGMLITAFSSSSYMAGTLSSLVITPTCMVGGCFWPLEYMPEFMQKIALFMPQRWVLDAVQKLQRGSELSDILLNLVILLAFAAALFLVSIYKFGRTKDVAKFV